MASVSKRQWTHKGVKKEAWTVRYVDAKGIRRSRQFETKKAADAYRREVERDTYYGVHVPHADTVTVGKAIDLYLDSISLRVRDGRISRSRYTSLETAMRLHIVPELGAIKFRELSIAAVDGLYAAMLNKGIGSWRAKSVIGDLKLVERFAHRSGFSKSTAVTHALADLRGIRPNKVEPPSIELAMKIMRHAIEFRPGIRSRAAAMMACLVHLAACCGMRLGEILALDLDHLDLDGGEIRIRRNITAFKEVKGPKTISGIRDVPLPPHLVGMLQQWLETHYIDNPERFVFVSASKQVPTGSDINSRWKTLLRECDALNDEDPLHFHSLRHFAGSWWLHQGMKVADVSKILGHANPGITLKVYAHTLTDDGERKALVRSAASLLMQPVTHNAATEPKALEMLA